LGLLMFNARGPIHRKGSNLVHTCKTGWKSEISPYCRGMRKHRMDTQAINNNTRIYEIYTEKIPQQHFEGKHCVTSRKMNVTRMTVAITWLVTTHQVRPSPS
jgi:hypothetical protein